MCFCISIYAETEKKLTLFHGFWVVFGKKSWQSTKKSRQYIDPSVFLAYNRNMVHMKGKIGIYILRVLFIILCLMTAAFIFSNSLKTGEVSAAQSSSVVDTIKDCVGSVAPDSKIANATGSGYKRMHAFVRRMAHFSEFAVLGVLLVCTCFSFTYKKKWLFLPLIILLAVAVSDELLQGFVAGRVADVADVIMDVLGGLTGGMVALAGILWIFLIQNKRARRLPKSEEELGIDVVVVKRG